MAYGYNPYGGYGVPAQAMYPPQAAYAPQMGGMAQTQPAQPAVNVRLVTSRDEATTAQIPFDATINVFVNLAAGEIYVKRFNPNTGGAWFGDYIAADRARQNAQEAEAPQPEPVTMDMFLALEQRVTELSDAIAPKRTTRGGRQDE